MELDFDDPAQAKLGADLKKLLRSFVNNRSFDDSAGSEPPSALSLHRWFSLWWLTSDNLFFWRLKMQQSKEDLPESALLHPNLPSIPSNANDSPSDNPELDAALKWLAAHQSQDGSWSSAGFSQNCAAPEPGRRGSVPTQAEIEAARCEGAGYPNTTLVSRAWPCLPSCARAKRLHQASTRTSLRAHSCG